MTGKIRAMVVDDDVNFLMSTVDLLNEKGLDCVGVPSGREAIEKAKEMSFDVVLMDMKMPVMNGVQTHREIKKISPKTVVIMITAHRVEELIKDALREGAYGLVHKPLDIDRIIRMIERSKKGGALVMVVDDDPNTCQVLKDNLEEQGYVVTTANDGHEAVRIVKEKPEEVIFIDAKIPPINGLMIYLEIKKINPDIVAVMMTAYREEMEDIIDRAIKEGVYACLYKPFSIDEIIRLMEEIIAKKGR